MPTERTGAVLFVLDTATPTPHTFIVSGPARVQRTSSFRIRKRGPFGLGQLWFGELGQGECSGPVAELSDGSWPRNRQAAAQRRVGPRQVCGPLAEPLVMANDGLQTHRQRRSGTLTSAPHHDHPAAFGKATARRAAPRPGWRYAIEGAASMIRSGGSPPPRLIISHHRLVVAACMQVAAGAAQQCQHLHLLPRQRYGAPTIPCLHSRCFATVTDRRLARDGRPCISYQSLTDFSKISRSSEYMNIKYKQKNN